MAATKKLIQTIELTASQASIEFTNIPQTGTDLIILFSARGSNNDIASGWLYSLNGSSSGYSARSLNGTGSSTNSYTDTTGTDGGVTYGRLDSWGLVGNTATANTFENMQIVIPNYATSTSKVVSVDSVGENNSTAAFQRMMAGVWTGNAPITSLLLRSWNTVFLPGTSASLYVLTKGTSNGVTVS